LRFIDLFAGVGGFRLGMERAGHECVGWCEIDEFCQRVYRHRWPDGGWFWDDATTLPTDEVPDFDVLVAGFPCQSWSIAGKRRGFEDARGTLFFEIARILHDRQPRAFLLENVKGLVCRPFRDREFRRMLEILSDLGYAVQWRVLNSKDYGVPQNRERVFIVGQLSDGLVPEFPWPKPRPLTKRLADVLEPEVPEKYYLREKTLRALLEHLRRHRERGHGFGARFLDPEADVAGALRSHGLGHTGTPMVANTISARYYKDGSENLVLAGRLEGADRPTNRVYSPEGCSPALTTPSGGRHVPMVAPFPIRFPNRNQRRFDPDVAMTVDGSNTTGVALGARVRRLTPRECERLQGFPDDWTRWGVDERTGKVVEMSDTQRYKMMGNAVTVPVAEALGRAMARWLGA